MATQTTTSGRNGEPRALERDIHEIEDTVERVAGDVNALVQAWSQANAEIVKGAVSVVGSLILGLNATFSGLDWRRTRPEEPGEESRARDAVDQVNEVISGVSRNLSDALTGTSDVLQRSGQRFQETYQQAAERGGDKRRRKPAGKAEGKAESKTESG